LLSTLIKSRRNKMDELQTRLYEMEQKNPSPSLGLKAKKGNFLEKCVGAISKGMFDNRIVEQIAQQDGTKYIEPMEQKIYDRQENDFSNALYKLYKLPEDLRGKLIRDWFGIMDVSPKEAINEIIGCNAGAPVQGSRYVVWRKEDGREFHTAIFQWGQNMLSVKYQGEFDAPSGSTNYISGDQGLFRWGILIHPVKVLDRRY
jgi:hypothetical protein